MHQKLKLKMLNRILLSKIITIFWSIYDQLNQRQCLVNFKNCSVFLNLVIINT